MTAENGDYIAHVYDGNGNLIDKSNHMPDTTRTNWKRWDYNHPTMPGKLWKETQSDGTFTAYDYDDAGNLVSKTDAKGITVTYAYDDLNRLTAAQFPDSGQNVTYTYDQGTNRIGHLTGFTDPSGSTSYGYDAKGLSRPENEYHPRTQLSDIKDLQARQAAALPLAFQI